MKNKKVSCKGNISTVIAAIIGVLLLCSIFYHYFFINLDLERYNIINQYARDILLVSETKDYIEKDYLETSLDNLERRIVKKDDEFVNMYITINEEHYDVRNMPNLIQTDFGETIEISIEYHYKPQRLDFSGKLVPTRKEVEMEIMGVTLTTISKNRGVSDG